tara:strand:- start:3342 stop:4097 length:756 start_codon:yes stop_codon:yes gene_type:complete
MNINNILNNASNCILNNKNILNILNNSSNINIQNNKNENQNKYQNKQTKEYQNKQTEEKENIFFYPEEKFTNDLFWCWYIFINNLNKYYNITNIFKEEQEIKISYVNTIRDNKKKLKEIKLKKTQIENDLIYQKQTTFDCIYALCYIFNYNFIYFTDKLYFEHIIDEDNKTCIIKKTNNKHSICLNVKSIHIDEIKNKLYKVQNIKKPLKSISSYKKSDLENICNTLNIKINDDIKITKKILYMKIQEYIL